MSDEKMIRLENLRWILRLRGLDAQGLSDLMPLNPKTGKPKWSRSQCADLIADRKSFGEKAARFLETEVLGIPRFWLDEAHDHASYSDETLNMLRRGHGRPNSDSTSETNRPTSHTSSETPIDPPVHTGRLLPLLLQEQLHMIGWENAECFAHGCEGSDEVVPSAPKAKWIRLFDDALNGGALPMPAGTMVKIDPSKLGAPGKIVLVSDPDGNYYVRLYQLKKAPDHWVAAAPNSAFLPLDSREHNLTVLGEAVQSLITL